MCGWGRRKPHQQRHNRQFRRHSAAPFAGILSWHRKVATQRAANVDDVRVHRPPQADVLAKESTSGHEQYAIGVDLLSDCFRSFPSLDAGLVPGDRNWPRTNDATMLEQRAAPSRGVGVERVPRESKIAGELDPRQSIRPGST